MTFSMNLHGHNGPANSIDRRRPLGEESFHSHFQEFVTFLI